MDNNPDTIKWRGSVYNLENVENGTVYWYNPVSRHHDMRDIDIDWAAERTEQVSIDIDTMGAVACSGVKGCEI